jgi:hypothetical protein
LVPPSFILSPPQAPNGCAPYGKIPLFHMAGCVRADVCGAHRDTYYNSVRCGFNAGMQAAIYFRLS